MKILFITDLYPVKDNEHTTPKTLLNFVKEWEKADIEVDVIKPNFILNSFLRGKPFYKTGWYNKVYNVNFWTPFWFNVKNKLPKTDHYDLVIAHMPSGILLADKLDQPFIAGIHNSDLEVLRNPLYKIHFRKRMEKAIQNAKAIACRSYVIEKKLVKMFPNLKGKIFTAPSGIDENIIKDFDENKVINPHKIKVLTCAHLKKRKNIDKLIKACKNLENIELTVIGDGKIKKSLEKIDKKVNFTGRLTSEEVYEKMAHSDIFILPSVGETFGMVYLEAMANGCITVCTENDGIAGIIKNGENGFLIKPNVEDIANLLKQISSTNQETLKAIRYNSFTTIKEITSRRCADEYLQQIFKIL